MRNLLPWILLAIVGCQHCPRFLDCMNCDNEQVGECPPDAECKQVRGRKVRCPPEAPCPKSCPKNPDVEVCVPKPIHVKLPPQQIVVHEAPPQPTARPQAFAPQSFSPQSAPFTPQGTVMVPVVQTPSSPAGAARPGLTIDFFNLPIPFPRLIAVPSAAPTIQMAAVSPQAFAPQAFVPQAYAPQAYAPQAYAPQAFAPQAYAPQAFAPQAAPAVQPHAMVPVQGSMNVPVQGSVNVPFQTHVPVPVQPQAFAPQGAVFTPQAAPAQRMIPIVPQSAAPQMNGITLQQAEEFCRLVEQMKKQQQQMQQGR